MLLVLPGGEMTWRGELQGTVICSSSAWTGIIENIGYGIDNSEPEIPGGIPMGDDLWSNERRQNRPRTVPVL